MDKSFRRTVLAKAKQKLETAQSYFDEGMIALRQNRITNYFSDRDMGDTPDFFWILGDLPFAFELYCTQANDLLDVFDWQRRTGTDKMPIVTGTGGGARIFLRAGLVQEARALLPEVMVGEIKRDSVQIKELCLLSAQAGLGEVAKSAVPVARVRPEKLPFRGSKKQAALLMGELFVAEMHFLLGEYRECKERLADVLEAKRMIQEEGLKLFSDTEKAADFEMAEGLQLLLYLMDAIDQREKRHNEATAKLEKSLQYNYRLGEFQKQCYRCRLYTLMAKDILEERKPNPNPFEGKCERISGRVP